MARPRAQICTSRGVTGTAVSATSSGSTERAAPVLCALETWLGCTTHTKKDGGWDAPRATAERPPALDIPPPPTGLLRRTTGTGAGEKSSESTHEASKKVPPSHQVTT